MEMKSIVSHATCALVANPLQTNVKTLNLIVVSIGMYVYIIMSVYVLYMTVHVHIYSFAAMYTACVKVHMQRACAPPNPIITCGDQLVGVYMYILSV